MKIYRVVVGPIEENCYFVKNEKTNEGIIVDPGDEALRIMRGVEKAGIKKVPAIFITHGHGDHVSALDEVKKATGAKVYMSREDAPMLRVWNNSLSYSTDRDKTFDPPDVYFEDGMTVTEAGMTFKIAATPGHTEGGVCIIGDGFAFCGDTIFLESIGRTDLPGGSYDDIIQSIKTKILTLPDDYTLYPGHGPETTVGWERRRNPFLQ
ncbi:MAG: MBL fold metallo-hydrolase [Acidaminococcus sp.]|jgi:glyoxylase-like metal-dependent hydrolase (beta-lactamase superfamily II)|nr:MBL fold metallo-hydrolase [Acidaminococcus sp.]MCI2100130.1 MBL fold metallo-hydrolase [Acidaminococcus sp.]MCI2114449.1 MBL fold metallo-hydrolase [Acidaminococcus sp.]MCI2116384.1 MBL fold metallo-hydrolase [Acidaminococcus sp.]